MPIEPIIPATPVKVLERRAVPRTSLADLNELDLDQLRDRLARTRRDDRPVVVKVLDMLDAPRNKIIANVFPSLEKQARERGDVGTGGTGRVTGADVLKSAGIDNRIVNGILGFGLDIATDPLTYIGPAGWGAQAGKVALRKGGQKALSAGVKAAAEGGLDAVREPVVRGVMEAGGLTASRIDRLRVAEAAGRLGEKVRPDGTIRKATTVASVIDKRLRGDATGGRVSGALARVGGETTSQGGMLGKALDTTVGASDYSRRQIESARALAAKFGRGTGKAFKIGVGPDSVGSEIAHIPGTDWTIQVPAFTSTAKQAAVAQGVYRDKKLGLDLLTDIPVIGTAHQAVESMRRAIGGLESENSAYTKLAEALKARIADGDNTAVDALRDLDAQRVGDTERRMFEINTLRQTAADNVAKASGAIAASGDKFGPDAMLALGDLRDEAIKAAALFARQRDTLTEASKLSAGIRSQADAATAEQVGPLERLLGIQESTRRGYAMKVAGRNATPNDIPVPSEFYPAGKPAGIDVADAHVNALLPLTAKAKARRIDDLYGAMEALPGGKTHPLWDQYQFEIGLLRARPELGMRTAKVSGDDVSQFSRPYLRSAADGRPTISGNAEVRASVMAKIKPLVSELEQALKDHRGVQADAQGGLFTGTERVFADEFARSEGEIARLRDELHNATAPLRNDPNQVPADEWIDSIREANVQRSSPRALAIFDKASKDPAGSSKMVESLHAANSVATDYARTLDGVISQFATGPQRDAAEAVRYAIGASDISAGYSLTTPFATVAKNLFRSRGMSDESLAVRTIDAIERNKRRVFNVRKGDQIREIARANSNIRDMSMIARRDASQAAARELRSIMTEFKIPLSMEDEFRWYATVKTTLEAAKRDGVLGDFKIVKDGQKVDGPMLEWLRKFEQRSPLVSAGPGVGKAVDSWAAKTVDTIHQIRDAELDDGILESVLPGYVMSSPTVPARQAMRRQAKMPGFAGKVAQNGEEAFQMPRTTLKAQFQSPTTGEWKEFYGLDRYAMELSDADLAALRVHDPKAASEIDGLREAIAEYDALPADVKPQMVAADPFELNWQYKNNDRFRMLTGSDKNVDRLRETDITLLLGDRLAQHTRAVGKADLRQILGASGMNLGVESDAIKRIAQAKGSTYTTKGGVAVRVIDNVKTPGGGTSPILQINGVNHRFLSPNTVKENGNPIVDAIGEDLKNFVYPEAVADKLDDAIAYTSKTSDMLGHLSRATGIWKTSTLFHPSWIVSNVIGDAANALMGGAKPQSFFRLMPEMIKMRLAKGDPAKLAAMTVKVGDQTYTGTQLAELFGKYRAWNDNAAAEIMYQIHQNGRYTLPSQRGVGAGMSEDMAFLSNAYGQPLARLGKGGAMIAKGAAGARIGLDRLGRHVVGPYMHANAFVSDAMRASTMLAHMDEGADAGSAAERMIRSMFDYSDFSRIEDRGLRQLFPFYSWMRNNLSYQLQLLLERPAYAANFPRLKETIEDMIAGDEAVPMNMRPKWMQSQLALQIGSDPSSRFAFMLGNTIPAAEIYNVLAPTMGQEGAQHFVKYFVSGLNPVLSSPLQIGAGTEFFSGRTIGSAATDDQTPVEFLARQIRPISELGAGVVPGRIPAAFERGIGQGVARTVLGGRVQAFDAERLRTTRVSEYKKEEEGLRRQVFKAERNGDKEASLVGRAKMLQLYEAMLRDGLEDEVPKWARKQVGALGQ